MIGELIKTILIPKLEDEWVLIQTDRGLYSLRLGGFRKEPPLEDIDNYELLPCPYKNNKIESILSDDEWVYYITDQGGIIESGWTKINNIGEMELGVKFSSTEDYDSDYFSPENFFNLILNSQEKSERV